MRGLRRGSSWRWFWLARRTGSGGWSEASTAREAIRRATLVPPGKLPAWLTGAAAEAEHELTAPTGDVTAEGSSGHSEGPSVDGSQRRTSTPVRTGCRGRLNDVAARAAASDIATRGRRHGGALLAKVRC